MVERPTLLLGSRTPPCYDHGRLPFLASGPLSRQVYSIVFGRRRRPTTRSCHPRGSQHALGLVLSSGEGEGAGIPQDEERALELFKTAARGECMSWSTQRHGRAQCTPRPVRMGCLHTALEFPACHRRNRLLQCVEAHLRWCFLQVCKECRHASGCI